MNATSLLDSVRRASLGSFLQQERKPLDWYRRGAKTGESHLLHLPRLHQAMKDLMVPLVFEPLLFPLPLLLLLPYDGWEMARG